jgi:hypothetical protein
MITTNQTNWLINQTKNKISFKISPLIFAAIKVLFFNSVQLFLRTHKILKQLKLIFGWMPIRFLQVTLNGTTA